MIYFSCKMINESIFDMCVVAYNEKDRSWHTSMSLTINVCLFLVLMRLNDSSGCNHISVSCSVHTQEGFWRESGWVEIRGSWGRAMFQFASFKTNSVWPYLNDRKKNFICDFLWWSYHCFENELLVKNENWTNGFGGKG